MIGKLLVRDAETYMPSNMGPENDRLMDPYGAAADAPARPGSPVGRRGLGGHRPVGAPRASRATAQQCRRSHTVGGVRVRNEAVATGPRPRADELRDWDAAEGARFIDRLQAAAAQANPALVSPSLLYPRFESPCTKVAATLSQATAARRRADRTKARGDRSEAIAEFRAAVYEFTAPRRRPWFRRHRAATIPGTPRPVTSNQPATRRLPAPGDTGRAHPDSWRQSALTSQSHMCQDFGHLCRRLRKRQLAACSCCSSSGA